MSIRWSQNTKLLCIKSSQGVELHDGEAFVLIVYSDILPPFVVRIMHGSNHHSKPIMHGVVSDVVCFWRSNHDSQDDFWSSALINTSSVKVNWTIFLILMEIKFVNRIQSDSVGWY